MTCAGFVQKKGMLRAFIQKKGMSRAFIQKKELLCAFRYGKIRQKHCLSAVLKETRRGNGKMRTGNKSIAACSTEANAQGHRKGLIVCCLNF